MYIRPLSIGLFQYSMWEISILNISIGEHDGSLFTLFYDAQDKTGSVEFLFFFTKYFGSEHDDLNLWDEEYQNDEDYGQPT